MNPLDAAHSLDRPSPQDGEPASLEFETLAVRAGIHRSQFQEHAEALYLTSSFIFESAEQAATRFAGGEEGMVYTRYTNPTVAMFQDRLAALEGAESCVATSSGMAAILATALGVFWLVAVVRIKTERVQAAERRAMFGTDDELYSNR